MKKFFIVSIITAAVLAGALTINVFAQTNREIKENGIIPEQFENVMFTISKGDSRICVLNGKDVIMLYSLLPESLASQISEEWDIFNSYLSRKSLSGTYGGVKYDLTDEGAMVFTCYDYKVTVENASLSGIGEMMYRS